MFERHICAAPQSWFLLAPADKARPAASAASAASAVRRGSPARSVPSHFRSGRACSRLCSSANSESHYRAALLLRHSRVVHLCWQQLIPAHCRHISQSRHISRRAIEDGMRSTPADCELNTHAYTHVYKQRNTLAQPGALHAWSTAADPPARFACCRRSVPVAAEPKAVPRRHLQGGEDHHHLQEEWHVHHRCAACVQGRKSCTARAQRAAETLCCSAALLGSQGGSRLGNSCSPNAPSLRNTSRGQLEPPPPLQPAALLKTGMYDAIAAPAWRGTVLAPTDAVGAGGRPSPGAAPGSHPALR
jgi:hypothetical protein